MDHLKYLNLHAASDSSSNLQTTLRAELLQYDILVLQLHTTHTDCHCLSTMLVSQFLFLVIVAAATFPFITDALAASLQPAGRAAGVACKPQERDALLAFKKGITRDPEGRLASWQRGGHGQDCCRWRGVRCSNLTGHVVKLNLRNVYTDYSYGDEFDATALAGKISRSLLTLEYLEHLDLSWNNLAGPSGRIPEFLGSLKHLRYLDLSGIPFSGRVPPQLGNLSKLQYLDLSSIPFSGSVPPQLGNLSKLQYLDLSGIPFSGRVPPQLGNLSKLQYLDLGSDSEMYSTDLSWLTHLPVLRYLGMELLNLSTVVDWPHVVNMIPSLRVLVLYGCSLTSANQSLPHINLTNLEELDLSFNSFEHPVASCWFWNLTNLKSLVLQETGLYGQLPDALGGMASLQRLSLSESSNMSMMTTNLKKLCSLRILELGLSFSYGNIKEIIERLPHCSSNKLQELHLRGNQLTGVLPNWMGHLTSLVILDLSGNNITGSLPAFIGHLTSLVIIDLRVNNITGSLPAFIGLYCTSLNTLALAHNHLTGHVPSEISMLTNLTYLDLSDNELDGLITEEHFDGLKSLEHVDLSDNSLKIVVGSEWIPHFRLQEAHFASCQMGPLFPAWLKWQVDILYLDISSTGIIDRLPDWFSNVLSKVTGLDMSNNQVSGELPANMGIMSLDSLDFSSNNLTGQIPPLPRNLTILDISRNFLSGPLPSNLGAPMLDTLILFSNYITGQIPLSICELSLYALHLANNLFEGELPQCVRTTDMEYLLLSNNSFSGKFPPFLQSCTRLSFLDLASNRFSGTLPMWIGNLVELKFLRLSHNMFHGHIPNNITSLAKLYHLNLAANGISGVIPPHLSNLTAMTKRYIVDPFTAPEIQEAVVGELPVVTKRRELNYQGIGILEILSIDLSSNYLAGEIPEEMTSLKGLVNLNLSWNQLSGEVPDNIGDMQSLESLDLSKNNLSGEIPSSLSNLTYLSILDLSYNKLTGVIPSGRQLDTIYTENPLMYNGNSGLCGPPLQRKCSGSNPSSHGDQKRDEHDSEIMSVYFGLGLGFVFGLWVVFCVLLFKKTWRIAYFRLFYKVYDKLYVFVVVTRGRLARKATTN